MARACIKTYGNGNKRTYYRYSVIGILFKCEDPFSGCRLHLHPISSTQVAFYTMGGSQISRGDHHGKISH